MARRVFIGLLELQTQVFYFVFHPNLLQAAKKTFVNADTNIMNQTGFFHKYFSQA